MTDDELGTRLKTIASTYPKWMDSVSFQASQQFRKLVKRAAELLRKPRSTPDWGNKARDVLRDLEELQASASSGLVR